MQYASKEAEQLGVSQIMLLNSFVQIKTEILGLLIQERDETVLAPLMEKTLVMENTLDRLNDYYLAIPESEAEAKLRARGRNVVVGETARALVGMRQALEAVHEWCDEQSFDGWEEDVLQKTLHSLYHILMATARIIGNPLIFAKAQNPFETIE